MKIGIIGLGKMGEALVEGLRHSPHSKRMRIEATTLSKESAQRAAKKLRIPVHTDNLRLARACEVLILCVKPHQAQEVLEKIGPELKRKQILVSIAAGLKTRQMESWINNAAPVIRSMPNTPALIGEGMTVLARGSQATEVHLKIARMIFESVGRVTTVDESLMDGVTGLSGCGPAYVYLMIESLSEAGVKVGLPREKATLLAAQTLMGASKMVLERGDHPAALKDEVTTPAGCTIDGLMALEEGKLRVTLIKAVLAASERSSKL